CTGFWDPLGCMPVREQVRVFPCAAEGTNGLTCLVAYQRRSGWLLEPRGVLLEPFSDGVEAHRTDRNGARASRFGSRSAEHNLTPLQVHVFDQDFQHLPGPDTCVERYDDQSPDQRRGVLKECVLLMIRDAAIALVVLVVKADRGQATLHEW